MAIDPATVPPGFYLKAATTLKTALTNPAVLHCLHCGQPVQDRFWCDSCRVEALPPGDGYVAAR